MASKRAKQQRLLEEVAIPPSSFSQERIENKNHHSERWPHWSTTLSEWPIDRWDPMSNAPSEGNLFLMIRARDRKGRVYDNVHFAQDLSGEFQPAFSGWFDENRVQFDAVEWQPMDAGEDRTKPKPTVTDLALEMIRKERLRQISKGYTAERDSTYEPGELAMVGAMFAAEGTDAEYPKIPSHFGPTPEKFPWNERFWTPTTREENLVKALALITAELEQIIVRK